MSAPAGKMQRGIAVPVFRFDVCAAFEKHSHRVGCPHCGGIVERRTPKIVDVRDGSTLFNQVRYRAGVIFCCTLVQIADVKTHVSSILHWFAAGWIALL